MSQSDVSLYDETDYEGVARCDLCGLTTDHQHSWEEWGFVLDEAGPFDDQPPTVAEMDAMAADWDRRQRGECPAGGTHVLGECEAWDHRIYEGCVECGARRPRPGEVWA